MKKFTLLFAFIATFSFLNAQVYVQEDFSNNQMPPVGWSIDAFAGNWSASSSAEAGGTAPEGKFTYSQNVAVTRLISPAVDLTGQTSVTLGFSHFYDWYGNPAPKLGVATRSAGGDWNSVWEITPTGNVGPETHIFEITSADVGASDFEFCFYLDGDFYNLDYWHVDNIELFVPFAVDCEMTNLTVPPIVSGPTPVTGVITNKGNSWITGVDIAWAVEGGETHTTTITGLALELGDTYEFECDDLFDQPIGPHMLDVWVANVMGGGPDENPDNDMIMQGVNVASFSEQRVPNYGEFTSSTCAPCAGFNSSFVPWTETNADEITLIKYQMSWPNPGDPYYTEEGGVRRGYYGVSWVPWLVGDGAFINTSMADVINHFNAAMENPSFAAIASAHTLNGTVMDFTTTVLPYAGFQNARVHVIVFEKVTTGNTGNNGETEFHHVMMKMVPDANGSAIDFTDREPVTIEQTVDLAGTFVEEWDDLGVVVLVQDYNSASMYQSGYSVENGSFATEDNLVSLTVDGEAIPDFDPNVTEYFIELPEGTTVAPEVVGVAVDEKARVVVVPALELPGETTVDVFAEDLATHKKYTVHFTVLQGIDNPLAANVKLYPNPTSGTINISGLDKGDVAVYNSTGKMVAEFSNFTGGNIDISAMPNGIYFVNIKTDEHSVTKKIALNR